MLDIKIIFPLFIYFVMETFTKCRLTGTFKEQRKKKRKKILRKEWLFFIIVSFLQSWNPQGKVEYNKNIVLSVFRLKTWSSQESDAPASVILIGYTCHFGQHYLGLEGKREKICEIVLKVWIVMKSGSICSCNRLEVASLGLQRGVLMNRHGLLAQPTQRSLT